MFSELSQLREDTVWFTQVSRKNCLGETVFSLNNDKHSKNTAFLSNLKCFISTQTEFLFRSYFPESIKRVISFAGSKMGIRPSQNLCKVGSTSFEVLTSLTPRDSHNSA